MTFPEAERLVTLSQELREHLIRWGAGEAQVSRGEGLCACIVLVGIEAGSESAETREQFLAYLSTLAGWAFDLGDAAAKRAARALEAESEGE